MNKNVKINNPMKVITGPDTRWSYANVWEPKSINGGTPKYSVSLIISKSDTKTIAKIEAAIEAAYKEGEAKLKGNGKSVPALSVIKTPLRDGDMERPDDPAYANAYFVNANAISAPGIVDADRNPILTRSEVYSGVYGRASISFYAFNSSGNKGIACGLNNLQKIRDGEPLGGKKVIEKVTVNPRYYAKMSEILDKLIEERKQGVLDYAEMLEKYIKLAKDVDCPEDNDKYPESIRKSKALMAIYDNTGEDDATFIAHMDKRMPNWREIRKELNDSRLDYYEAQDESPLQKLIDQSRYDDIRDAAIAYIQEERSGDTKRLSVVDMEIENVIHIEQPEDGVIAFDVITSCDVEMSSASHKGYFNERWLKIHCQVRLKCFLVKLTLN